MEALHLEQELIFGPQNTSGGVANAESDVLVKGAVWVGKFAFSLAVWIVAF